MLCVQRRYGNCTISKIMTNQPSSHTVEDSSSLASQLRHLQQSNQQLEESLKLQLEFLSIHMNLHDGMQQTLFTPLLIKRIQEQHTNLHQQHSRCLLAKQIQVQEEREMKELIKSYEGRIGELQVILRSKEAEIAEVMEDQGTNNLPRRENLRKLNIQCIQKNSIHKALQDLKRLNVENEALEHCLKQKASQKRLNHNQKRKNTATLQPVKPQSIGQTFKEKIQNMPHDKLLMKVYELLQQQVAKEDELKSQLSVLKEDWEKTSKVHKQLVKKYKQNDAYQGNMNKRQNYCENGDRGLNFLQELQRAESHTTKENTLFHRVDMNVQKNKGKSERKKITSRERHRPLKEN